MNKSVEKLKCLYEKSSKHSHYQILASSLNEIIENNDLCIKSRYERERLEYIVSILDPTSKKILDIGGNTGFFTFELIKLGAELVTYYEGNQEHAHFVEEASYLLEYDNQIIIHNEYLSFQNELVREKYDIVLLLNVLHHIGDDYGDKKLSIENAKKQIVKSVNNLVHSSEYLVMQLGFCWKGDKNKTLFENGTKKEMIDYLIQGIRNYWDVIDIGIPEQIENAIKYVKLNHDNIKRDDSLGEFLNRPIFVLKSK